MTLHRALLFLSLALALACLAGGYAQTPYWPAAVLALVPAMALALHSQLAAAWLPPACLAALAVLAAAGVLAGAPALLMIPGVAASLAAWDLVNLDRRLAEATAPAGRFVREHTLLLALALGAGLLLAASGRLLAIQVPFLLLVLLIVLDLFSLDRASRYLRRDRDARG